MLKISIMVQICVYDEEWKIKIEFFQVCCPKDETVLFPNEWKKFKENHTDAKLRQHEIEILIRQSNEYEYYYSDNEYEYEAVNTFQPCNEPLQCVSADNCRSGFDSLFTNISLISEIWIWNCTYLFHFSWPKYENSTNLLWSWLTLQ